MAFDPKKIKFPSEKEILERLEKIIDKEIKGDIDYDPMKIRQQCCFDIMIPEGLFTVLKNNQMIYDKLNNMYKNKGWEDIEINENSCLHNIKLKYYFD